MYACICYAKDINLLNEICFRNVGDADADSWFFTKFVMMTDFSTVDLLTTWFAILVFVTFYQDIGCENTRCSFLKTTNVMCVNF